jgi:hypothetical protein
LIAAARLAVERELPILFTSEMVRAVLDGRKYVTRREIDPPVERRGGAWYWSHRRYDNGAGVHYFHSQIITPSIRRAMLAAAPYLVGDRLYVRETYAHSPRGVFYLADYRERGDVVRGLEAHELKWSPSIHMPKRVARTFLRVTAVRVERLCSLTKADALAEGFDSISAFAVGWNSISDAKWRSNPWVWVFDFERETGELSDRSA